MSSLIAHARRLRRTALLLVVIAGLAGGLAQAQDPPDLPALKLDLSITGDSDLVVNRENNPTIQIEAALTYTNNDAAETPQTLAVASGGNLNLRGSVGVDGWGDTSAKDLAIPEQHLLQPPAVYTTTAEQLEALKDEGGLGTVVARAKDGWAVAADATGTVYLLQPDGEIKWALEGPGEDSPIAIGESSERSLAIAQGRALDPRVFCQFRETDNSLIAVGIPGATVTVTDPSDNSTMELANAGAVLIYNRTSAAPIARAIQGTRDASSVFTSAPTANGRFGASLAIGQGGGGGLAVSEPGAGKVHLFDEPCIGWGEEDEKTKQSGKTQGTNYLISSVNEPNPSLAISSDEENVVAVGAPSRNGGKGGVLLFVRPGGGWVATSTPTAALSPDSAVAGKPAVGTVVAVSGDGSVVTASGHGFDSAASPADTWPGAAFVWVKGSSDWADQATETARLTKAGGAAGERFGDAVAIRNDGNQIAVAHSADSSSRGAVYFFTKPDAGWSSMTSDADGAAVVRAPQSEQLAGGRFGAALDWSGGHGDDGLAVGQPGRPQGDTESPGRVFNLKYDNTISGKRSWCTAITDDDSGTITYRCPLLLDGSSALTPFENDPVTIQARGLRINDQGVDTLTGPRITFSQAVEVDRVDFVRAEGQSSTLQERETANFELRILNAAGRAANPSAIQSINLIATGWGITVPEISQLGASAAEGIPTNKIPLLGRAPSSTGRSTLTLIVTPVAGRGSEVLFNQTLTMTVTGGPRNLILTSPDAKIYYRPTEDDHRDRLRFSVRTTDRDDRSVAVPSSLNRWDVYKGDTCASRSRGTRVTDQFSLERDPAAGTSNGQVHLELLVTGRELAPGPHILCGVEVGSAKGERTFSVAGPPSKLTLTDTGSRLFGNRITFTARVTDSRGALVIDGTPVTFEAQRVRLDVLAPINAGTRLTENGRAVGTFLVIATGQGAIRACAGNACDVWANTVGGIIGGGGNFGGGGGSPGGGGGTFVPPPPPPPPDPASQLSERALNKMIEWNGRTLIRAAELLDSVEEAELVFLWNGQTWLGYARIDGRVLPGSVDFIARNGDTLWLGARMPAETSAETPTETSAETPAETPAESESP